MSWLARSLANSLRPDPDHGDDGDGDGEDDTDSKEEEEEERSFGASPAEGEEPGTPTRGVKEDLSELTKTLTRQFWGVASFLAPPPSNQDDSLPYDGGRRPEDSSDTRVSVGSDEAEAAESPRIAGIRSDFAEIGGKFKTGISMLSKNKAVSEISKIASTFLPFGEEEKDEEGEEEEEEEEAEENYGDGAVGVTDEVLAFARNISMHPETWLDFPLIPDDEDSDDFEMSDAQQEHALVVERLAPRLAALRIELCPSHMSEGCFWKIYFVLLHSRLNRHDSELLSTPQIVQARALLLQDLQNRTKPSSEGSGRGVLYRTEVSPASPEENAMPQSKTLSQVKPSEMLTSDEPTTCIPITDYETEKHPVQTTEVKIVDKSVIEEDLSVQVKTKDFHTDASNISIQKYEEEGDDWLEEEGGEISGSRGTAIPLGNEDDVSFSDLEEEDDEDAPTNSSTMSHSSGFQPKDSKGSWVQLNKSTEGAVKGGDDSSPQNKESNEWLSVDDIDDD